MTNRQLATYNLILKNSLEGKVTTQEEIVSNYPKATYSDGYNYSDNPKVHDKCFQIEAFPKHWTIQFNARRTLFT